MGVQERRMQTEWPETPARYMYCVMDGFSIHLMDLDCSAICRILQAPTVLSVKHAGSGRTRKKFFSLLLECSTIAYKILYKRTERNRKVKKKESNNFPTHSAEFSKQPLHQPCMVL